MSIKNNITTCGTSITNISPQSHKKVIRICDKCGDEKELVYKDCVKQSLKLTKYNLPYQHLCRRCSQSVISNPMKGKNHSLATRKKCSESQRTRFVGYTNKRYLLDRYGSKNPCWKKGIRTNSSGYIVKRYLGKQILLHREKYENYYNVKLNRKDHVHHIDGNTLNNNINNLVACTSSDHKKAHWSLENAAFKLFAAGVILFDAHKKLYYVNPKYTECLIPISLGFNDVSIQQEKNVVKSRLDIDISSEIINGISRPTPFIGANMSTVCNAEFCIQLYKVGAIGVLHRAADKVLLEQETKKISAACPIIAVSVGVGDDQFDLAKSLILAGANIIFIDIAHGYCDTVVEMAREIKKISRSIKVVCGNTTNPSILFDLHRCCDAVKVGIGQGLACDTKNTAGCTEKMFSTVLKFKELSRDLGIPIISDGGIRIPADCVKAIGAGASSVMMGSVFAMCPESAAEIVMTKDGSRKLYAGMASRYVQTIWKNGLKQGTCPEGNVVYLPVGESLEKLIERYSGALKSGITYTGAHNIKSFQDRVQFVRVDLAENARERTG